MKTPRTEEATVWGQNVGQLDVLARNVSMDYVAISIELILGIVMLPFNVSHLGQSSYGLWVLAASVTAYFSMLDLGYGVAQVKFAASYRARRDVQGLNQIVSTLFVFFTLMGAVAFAAGIAIAFNLQHLFNITPEQSVVGRQVVLMISGYIALGFPISVFGGVVNGFQRHFLNGYVSIVTSLVVAGVNVAVLLAGYGLVELVAATTAVRLLAYAAYCANAYRAFPGLAVRLSYVRIDRLREVTGFSTFILLIDLANKLNYSTDTLVIGAFMTTGAVAVWAVGQRLISAIQTLTTQLNGALFPVVVDAATTGDAGRLRRIFVQGTRLSLAMVIPISVVLSLLARHLILAWVGPSFIESVPVIYVLSAVVAIRVGNSTATTLLKGADRHRFLAASNLGIAVGNLALSVALVGRYGLVGVAVGTLIPLAAVSMGILFPAACRRVALPLTEALRDCVWPALWPVIPVGLIVLATSTIASVNLPAVAVQSVAAGAIYLALFLGFAIGREERFWYLAKVRLLLRKHPSAAPAC